MSVSTRRTAETSKPPLVYHGVKPPRTSAAVARVLNLKGLTAYQVAPASETKLFHHPYFGVFSFSINHSKIQMAILT